MKVLPIILLFSTALAVAERKPVGELECDDALYVFIASWEGFSPVVYTCPAGHPTIGYGKRLSASDVVKIQAAGGRITQAEGLLILKNEAAFAVAHLRKMVTVPLHQHEFHALVSWVYNCGVGAAEMSTLVRLLNQGHYETVPRELIRWIYSAGKPIDGLYNRRIAEAHLWTHGRYLNP